jgi:hypothetical protein
MRCHRFAAGAALVALAALAAPVVAPTPALAPAAAVTATRTSHLTGWPTAPLTLAKASTWKATVRVSAPAGRSVLLQFKAYGTLTWVTRARVKTSATRYATVGAATTKRGYWRVVAPATGVYKSVTSASRYVSIAPPPDTTPPGPITRVEFGQYGTRQMLALLTYTDGLIPPDFAGVEVHRAVGLVAPAVRSPSTLVGRVTSFGYGFLDRNGLVSLTTYSYAYWTYDTHGNYSTRFAGTAPETMDDGLGPTHAGSFTYVWPNHGWDGAGTGLNGVPVHYDPCHPIRWSIDLAAVAAGARSYELGRVTAAFTEAARASGYTFMYAGEVAIGDRSKENDVTVYTANDADIVISFGREIGAAGWGGFLRSDGWRERTVGGVTSTWPRGYAQYDLGTLERDEPDGDTRDMILYLHEIGHALGMGHVDDEYQVMAPGVGYYDAFFRAGDVAGLSGLHALPGSCPS